MYTYYFMISFLPYFLFTFVGLYADALQSCYTKRKVGCTYGETKRKKKHDTTQKWQLNSFLYLQPPLRLRMTGCFDTFSKYIMSEEELEGVRSSHVYLAFSTPLYLHKSLFHHFLSFSVLHFWCFITFCLLFLFLFRYNSKYMYLWHMHPYTHISSTCSPLLAAHNLRDKCREREFADEIWLRFCLFEFLLCVHTYVCAFVQNTYVFTSVYTDSLAIFFAIVWSNGLLELNVRKDLLLCMVFCISVYKLPFYFWI